MIAVLAFAGIVVAIMQTLLVPVVAQLPVLLSTSASNATWVMTATLLAGAVATPIMGRLGDLFGKRRMMLVSLALMVVGSLVCAFTSQLTVMVAGRALQGFAMGAIPLGISIMRDELPRERLGSAMALMSSSIGIGGAIGLPLAAVIAEHANWHVLFYSSAGVGVVSIALILLVVPESAYRAPGRFDVLGTIGLTAGLVALLLPITKGSDWGWGSPTTLGLFGAAVLILLLWGVLELRLRDPLVDLRTTARRQVLLTNLASIMVGVAFYAMSLVLPQLLELPTGTGYGLGKSLVVAGLTVMPMGLAMMLVSPLSARLTAARGAKTSLILGLVIIAAGYGAGLGLMNAVWQVALITIIVGAGIGFAYSSLPTLIIGAVDASETGAANGLNTLMRSIGTSVSSAIVGMVLAHNTTVFAGRPQPNLHGFRLSFLIATAAVAVGVLIAAFLPRRSPRPAANPAGTETSPLPAAAAPAAPATLAAPVASATAGGHGGQGSPAGPGVYGRVLGTGGAPVPHASVTAIDPTGRQLGLATADSTGFYRLPLPAAGPGTGCVLIASSPGHQPEAATVSLAAEAPIAVDLSLAGVGGLAGTVTDPDGSPLSGVLAVAADPYGEVVGSATTGADGGYRLPELAPGRYVLALTRAGRRPSAVPVEVTAGGPTRQDAVLAPAAAVRGTVTDPVGRPLPEARVSLLDSAGQVVGLHLTGPDGRYAFDGLAGEDFTVVAAGYPPVATTVTIAGSGRDDMDLHLSHEAG
nr:MFS transporter [Phaeacidiphilus oryzae]